MNCFAVEDGTGPLERFSGADLPCSTTANVPDLVLGPVSRSIPWEQHFPCKNKYKPINTTTLNIKSIQIQTVNGLKAYLFHLFPSIALLTPQYIQQRNYDATHQNTAKVQQAFLSQTSIQAAQVS